MSDPFLTEMMLFPSWNFPYLMKQVPEESSLEKKIQGNKSKLAVCVAVAGEIKLSCLWDSKIKCFSFCSDPGSSHCKIFTYSSEYKSGAFGAWKFDLAGAG